LFSPTSGIAPPEIEAIRGREIHEQVMSFIDRPSWIRIFKLLGISIFPSIEILCLVGILISFFGFVFQRFCILPVFVALWTFYYSLVDISKTFHQQCDDLLLEAGLIVILLAPGFCSKRYGTSDNVMLMLMRWVLFR